MNSFHENTTTIIKIGTDVVTTNDGRLNVRIIQSLVDQVMAVRAELGQVMLVTSGAVAAGRSKYGRKKTKDESRETKRMYAAAGQSTLQRTYEERLWDQHECIAHQILLTKQNFSSKARMKTLLGTLGRIADDEQLGLPIFNENDPIADEEIRFSDNDQLAAKLARLVNASRVVLLTGKVQGLMRDVDKESSLIRRVRPSDQEKFARFVTEGKSANGTGGMELKYMNACELANDGIQTHIVNGKIPHVLERLLLEKESIGTVFQPRHDRFTSK